MVKKLLIAAALVGVGAYAYTKYKKVQKEKTAAPTAPGATAPPALATNTFAAPLGSTILNDSKRTLLTMREDMGGDVKILQDKLFNR